LKKHKLELLKYGENDTWLFFLDFVIFFSKCKIFNYILGNITALPSTGLESDDDHVYLLL